MIAIADVQIPAHMAGFVWLQGQVQVGSLFHLFVVALLNLVFSHELQL